jgi:hypothetical protein
MLVVILFALGALALALFVGIVRLRQWELRQHALASPTRLVTLKALLSSGADDTPTLFASGYVKLAARLRESGVQFAYVVEREFETDTQPTVTGYFRCPPALGTFVQSALASYFPNGHLDFFEVLPSKDPFLKTQEGLRHHHSRLDELKIAALTRLRRYKLVPQSHAIAVSDGSGHLHAVAGRLVLTADSALPLIDPEHINHKQTDELAHIFSTAGHGPAASRVIISADYRPADDKWRENARELANSLKAGEGLTKQHSLKVRGPGIHPIWWLFRGVAAVLFVGGLYWTLGKLGITAPVWVYIAVAATAFIPGHKLRHHRRETIKVQTKQAQKQGSPESRPATPEELEQAAEIKFNLTAASKPGAAFEAAFRITVVGPADEERDELRELLHEIADGFSVYSTEYQHTALVPEDPRSAILGLDFPKEPMVLNSAALAELIRVPNENCKPRGVKIARSRAIRLLPDHTLNIKDPWHPPKGLLTVGSVGRGTMEEYIAIDGEMTDTHFSAFG